MAHLVNGGKYPHPFFFSVSSNPVIDNLLPVGHKCPSSACRLRTAVLGNSGSSINGAIGAPIWKRESIMRALIALAIVLALGSLASAQSQYTSNRVCPGNVSLIYCNATNVSGSSVTVTMNLRREDGTLLGTGGAATSIAPGETSSRWFTGGLCGAGHFVRCEAITPASTSAIRFVMQGVDSNFATLFEAEGR